MTYAQVSDRRGRTRRGGAGLVRFRATSEPKETGHPTVTTTTVGRQTISVTVTAIGEINPANQVTVKPEVSGRIATIAVTTGQQVTKGDLLLKLDDTDLRTERDAALTEIDSARAHFNKAQRDLDRSRDLHASRLVSQEIFDNARTTQELASNDLVRAQKQLQSVDDKLKKITILAPFNGTVLSILVSAGQVVSGAAGVNQGTDLMTFANLDEMIIRAHINQVDITKIKPQQAVEITVDSLPGVTLAGEVILIAPVATVKNGVKGFNVDVLITRSDARVRPGMNANLSFPVVRIEQALSVPLAAVFTEENEKAVYVKTPTGSERRVVTLGATDFRHAEIKAGLQEAEVVLLEKPKSPKTGG